MTSWRLSIYVARFVETGCSRISPSTPEIPPPPNSFVSPSRTSPLTWSVSLPGCRTRGGSGRELQPQRILDISLRLFLKVPALLLHQIDQPVRRLSQPVLAVVHRVVELNLILKRAARMFLLELVGNLAQLTDDLETGRLGMLVGWIEQPSGIFREFDFVPCDQVLAFFLGYIFTLSTMEQPTQADRNGLSCRLSESILFRPLSPPAFPPRLQTKADTLSLLSSGPDRLGEMG